MMQLFSGQWKENKVDQHRNNYLPVIILLSGPLAILAVVLDFPSPLRWILVFWFLLTGPGMAFEYLLPGDDPITRFFLIIVLSFAFDAAVAQAILYLGWWSPLLILWILMGLCWVGILLKFTNINPRHASRDMLTNNAPGAEVAGLHFFLGILKRGWWLIVISILVAFNFSLLYSFYLSVPMYEAVAQFVVSPGIQNGTSAANNQEIPDEHTIISTYADILESSKIRNNTLELLLQNPDDFNEYTTSVVLFPDEHMIQFSVRGPDPQTTALLTNSIGQNAIDSIGDFYSAYNIDFLNKATIPVEPYQPRPVQNALLSLLIGVSIGAGLAMFLDQILTVRKVAKKDISRVV
ncbi:MAG: hypothetical protein JNK26_04900 [Candidatus Doudnabacteria bacterium]|nr:hypothetical protein [Candidatus Doudnabacteria bacterium]